MTEPLDASAHADQWAAFEFAEALAAVSSLTGSSRVGSSRAGSSGGGARAS